MDLVSLMLFQGEAWSLGRFSTVRTLRLPGLLRTQWMVSRLDASCDLLLWQVGRQLEYVDTRTGVSGRFGLDTGDEVSSVRVKDDVLLYVGGVKAISKTGQQQ